MSIIVGDASVVLRWILPDEVDRAGAQRLEDALRAGEVGVIVPSVFPFEVAAALQRAVVAGRIEQRMATDALDAVLALGFERDDAPPAPAETLRIALTLRARVPDASYLEVARRHGAVLVSADEAQLEAAGRLGLRAVRLADLPERMT